MQRLTPNQNGAQQRVHPVAHLRLGSRQRRVHARTGRTGAPPNRPSRPVVVWDWRGWMHLLTSLHHATPKQKWWVLTESDGDEFNKTKRSEPLGLWFLRPTPEQPAAALLPVKPNDTICNIQFRYSLSHHTDNLAIYLIYNAAPTMTLMLMINSLPFP